MPQTTKIENAKFIVTVDETRRIIRDGTIVIEGDRIAHVGKAAELSGMAADRVIDAREMVVTPGFVNGHMHISYAHAVRGVFPDDLGADYLPTVFRLQGAMTEEEEYLTSLLGITELLKYGTTCFLDPGSTKYLDACIKAYEEAGCRIIVGAQVSDMPNPMNVPVYSTDEAVSLMERTIRDHDGSLDGRVRAWAMPFAADYCSRELLEAAKGLADRYETGMTFHQSNTVSSVKAHLDEFGVRPIRYLEDIGVLGPNVLLAHLIGVDIAEIDAMARTNTKGVTCPTASLKSGGGLSVHGMLPEMLERGVCVCLGTDAGNNSNLIETMRSMYLTAIIYKDSRED